MSASVQQRLPAPLASFVIVVACAVAAVPACSSGDASSSSSSTSGTSGTTEDGGGNPGCPDDVPAACPPSPPTYAKDIAPLVATTCATCHSPSGRQSGRLLSDYDHIFAQRTAMLLQVSACRMPPSSAPRLTAEGRKALLAWLVCGARND